MVKLTREEACIELDVESDADEDTIKKAYKRLAFKWHPDKNLDKPEEAKSKFQKIYAAFQKLSNTHSDSEDSDDDFFMGEDMEDAFSFFMNMMHMMDSEGMRGSGRRGAGPGSAFGGMPHGMFFTTSMHGNPTVFGYGGSRPGNFFRDDDGDDQWGSRAQQQRQAQSWEENKKRAEREERRRQKEAASREQQRQQRAEQREQDLRRREAQRNRPPPKALNAQQLAEREEEQRKAISKLPRPTMASRTETNITLSLARSHKEDSEGRCEVAWRGIQDSEWSQQEVKSGQPVECTSLMPGSKYVFKARTGHPFNGKMLWGEWSVESQYVTNGQLVTAASSAAASAAFAAAAGPKKKERKRAPEKKNHAAAQQPVVDKAQALEQLKAQQEKEKAMKAAMEQAAADYAAETAKFQPSQPADVPQGAEGGSKKKKKRAKQKKAQQAEAATAMPEAQKENLSQQPNSASGAAGRTQGHPAASQAAQGRAGATAPPKAARDFGLRLPGQGPGQQGSQLPSAFGHQAGRGPGGRGQGGPLSAADIEWLNLQEAIQMSQALEESMRLYEEQNKMAPPDEGLRVDEDKFPSLPGGPSVPNLQTPSPAKSVYQSVASSLWARSPEQHAAAPQHAQQDPAPQHTQHELYETAPDASQPGASDHAQQAPQEGGWTAGADVQDVNGWDRTMPSARGDPVSWAEQQDQEVEATWQAQGQSAGYEHQEALGEQADGTARDMAYQQQQQQGSWEQPHQPAAHGQQGSWSQPQDPAGGHHLQQGGWEQPQSDPWQQQGSWEQPQQPADNSSWPHQSGWAQTQKPLKKKQAQKPAQPQQSGWDQAQQSGWDQPQQSGYGADAAHSHPQEQQNTAYGYEQQQMPSFNDWDAPQGYANDIQQQQGQYGKGGWERSPGGHPQWQGSLPKTAAWDSDPSPDRPSLHGQNSQRQNQHPQQAPWDPEPERQEGWTDGLSVEQLAHHDWVNGQSNNRNPDKQGTISRWNAESIHQDAWPDPEDRTPRQGHAQAAPHSSHHNQSSAHDQHADPYPDYAQQHLRPEANPGHTGQDTADYSRHSGYSQNPTKGFQQHQHSYQQDVGAQPYSHEQYNSGYDDHYGYTNAQHAAGRHQEADDGFIQSAPYELYSDPVISSAPYELYPDRGSVTADPYGAHLLASTTHAQGSEDPYYQGSARQGFQAAVGPAAQSQNRDLLSKQKQPDPLAFLNGHSSSSNPTSYPRASGQQHHHVTQKPQQHQAEPYDTSGWDAQDQTEPQAVYGNHHEAQTKQYQAPIRDGQRQRSSQRPPKRALYHERQSGHAAPQQQGQAYSHMPARVQEQHSRQQMPADPSAFSEADALHAMQQEQRQQGTRPRGKQAAQPYAQHRQALSGSQQSNRHYGYDNQERHANGGHQADGGTHAHQHSRNSAQRTAQRPSNPMFAHLFPPEAL